jgi:hypothetical protein
VAGGLQFTHVAGYHAGLVVQQILFRLPAKENRDIIPWATYTDPELAHVGLTEEEAARRHGGRISVLRWPYAENDRAQAERKTTRLIKMVVDRKARILGVSIAGAGAGEMINMWALAITNSHEAQGCARLRPALSDNGRDWKTGRGFLLYTLDPQTVRALARAFLEAFRMRDTKGGTGPWRTTTRRKLTRFTPGMS